MLRIVPCFALLLLLLSCEESPAQKDAETTPSDQAMPRSYRSEIVVSGIENPWGMAFLPDSSLLVTDKKGVLYRVKDGKKTSIAGLPPIHVEGQGGLMDLCLHPDYERNGWLYFTYASPEGSAPGSHTALMRAKLQEGHLIRKELLYKGSPNVNTGYHFGSRIAFDRSGYLYFSIGERGQRDIHPQDLSQDGGKIYRLHDDGSIPGNNPFVDSAGAKTAAYSYGHRNPQGLARNPATGEIWEHEHGPRGGDEINRIVAGANYGWPLASFGINYDGSTLTTDTTLPGMTDPLHYWVPSIAPCGMAFVTSERYPQWRGHLLVGSLKFAYVELCKIKGNKVMSTEKLLEGVGRVRNVAESPVDGYLYLGLEGEGIARIIPEY